MQKRQAFPVYRAERVCVCVCFTPVHYGEI